MARRELQLEDKTFALTLLEQGILVIRVAADLQVSRQAIYDLKRAAISLRKGVAPEQIVGSGGQKKTTARTESIFKREVMANPWTTAAGLKKQHPDLLKDVSVRTIQHRLQKDLGLPARRAAKKPLLAEKEKVAFLPAISALDIRGLA